MRVVLKLLAACGLLAVSVAVIFFGTLDYREHILEKKLLAKEITTPSTLFSSHHLPRKLANNWLILGEGTASEAERLIYQSLKNRPLYAPSWLDLAEVKIRIGETEKASQYIHIAIDLWGTRGVALWRAAMLWIQVGNSQEAIQTLRRYLRSQPKDVHKTLLVASRIEPDPDRLLADLIPRNDIEAVQEAEYYNQILRFAIKYRAPEIGNAGWNDYDDKGKLSTEIVESYINFLIRINEIDLAIHSWEDLGFSSVRGEVTNGGFEEPLSGFGFGWLAKQVTTVDWELDDQVSKSGDRSLKLIFHGLENINYYHISQVVPVQPGSTYEFKGYWKGEDVTTRATPYIELSSIDGRINRYSKSDSKRLSWDWSPVSAVLTMPNDARSLRIRIRRPISKALDNKVAGTIWFDELQLIKKQSSPTTQ